MTDKNLLNQHTLRIKNKTIILDTNALAEGFKNPNVFADLLISLTEEGCDLTSIGAVRLEFLSKNRSREELAKKIAFYTSTLTSPEIANRTFENLFDDQALLYAFGYQSNAFKAVDFMITALMKKYSNNVLLLTNDHHDFTTQLFGIEELLPLVQQNGSVIPLGLYSFSEEKYVQIIMSR